MGVKLELTSEDYEDGVAELLAQKFDGRGQVERDVRLPSRSGGKDRQIDILVRVPLADMGEELMVVDCKRYGGRRWTSRTSKRSSGWSTTSEPRSGSS